MLKSLRILLCITLFVFTFPALAKEHFFIVPKCLLANNYSPFHYSLVMRLQNLVLIKTNHLDEFNLIRNSKPRYCNGYIDVSTTFPNHDIQSRADAVHFLQTFFPRNELSDLMHFNQIEHQIQVNHLNNLIHAANLKHDISVLSALPDRYVNSSSGQSAAVWIKHQAEEIAQTHTNVHVIEVATPGAKQPSIVMQIGTGIAPAMVIGAHMDTLQRLIDKQPGADDDASGVAVGLEMARVILAGPYTFKAPIYFVWYAGGESGELGVQAVIQKFNQAHVPINAVLELDMAGYVNKNNVGIGVADDYTDAMLSTFVSDLVRTYLQQPTEVVRCGFACSDHMLWYRNGNRVVYPFETMNDAGNPYAHTRDDVLNNISLTHMVDFVKLGIAFVVELSGLEQQ